MAVLNLLVSGCLAHPGLSASRQEAPEAWLVLMRGKPLAQVTLTAGSLGNVVNVEVQDGTAEVTLGHKGPAKLGPVPEPSGLKVTLHQFDVRALALERYGEIEQALEEASWISRDNLAEEVLKATLDEELARALGRKDGQWAVTRLYDEVTSGHVSGEEGGQAQRVLATWAQHIGIERFIHAIEDQETRMFPVRKSGPTVADAVSPAVRAGPRGLEVSLSTNVYKYSEQQTLKLNGTTRVSVGYDEVVGVRLYDAGGAVRYVPALFLVEVSNAGARHTLQKCGEMFALGFTMGLGVGAGAGGAAANSLVWCDRAAVVIGLVLSVVDDHRGEILEHFGAKGARFLYATDVLASLVAFYGLGRVAVAVPRMVHGFRQAYLEMKASKAALSSEEQVLLGRIGPGVDELLEQAGKASKGGEVIPIERARKPSLPPAAEEQPLRATGTDVRLVPLGQQPAGPKAVANAGGGKPQTPLSPAASSSQSAGVTAERGAGTLRSSTGATAARGSGRFHPGQLADHFERHGADFGARSAAEYEQMASRFLTGPRSAGVLERVRPNGDVVRFEPATDAFGVVSRDGTIRTFYKPNPSVHGQPTNLDYFNAQ